MVARKPPPGGPRRDSRADAMSIGSKDNLQINTTSSHNNSNVDAQSPKNPGRPPMSKPSDGGQSGSRSNPSQRTGGPIKPNNRPGQP